MNIVAAMETRKRTISEDDVLGASLDQKRPRMSFFIRLESESSLDSMDDTESVYSIQDRETDVARDTSDTDSELESGSDLDSGAELVTIEYDVASLSSDGDGCPDYSSSGTEDQNWQAAAEGAVAAMLFDTSMDPWDTDGDTSDGSTIFEAFDFVVCRKDFGTCQQCKLHTANPAFRYCEKCFQARKTFFPPRPRPTRKRKHHDESRKRQRHAETLQNFLSSLEQADGGGGGASTVDDGNMVAGGPHIPDMNFGDIVVPQQHRPSTTTSSEAASLASTRTHDANSDSDLFDNSDDDEMEAAAPCRKRCKIDSAAGVDSALTQSEDDSSSCRSSTSKHSLVASTAGETEICSQDSGVVVKLEASSGEDATDGGSSLPSSQASSSAKTVSSIDAEMCIVCTSAPKNSVFVHGSIAHRSCCYKCAMRVWNTCKRCPVCNCKVKNVLKVFTA